MTRRIIAILGTMKSGTTTLFDHLARHPAIAPAYPKEAGFFAFEDIHAQGPDWYDSLFRLEAGHAWRLDGSTDYMKAPFVTGVQDRMEAWGDEVRALAILRHPLRRIESHARHVQRTRKELGQQISPRPDHSLEAGISPVSLAISDYARQLDVWRPWIETGRLHVMTLEALTADPEATLAPVWRFLDLDPMPPGTAALPESNRGSEARTRENPVVEALGQSPLLGLAKRVLPEGLRKGMKARLRQEVRVEGRFRLTEPEAEALAALYRPRVAELGREYGLDVSAWGDLL